MAADVIYPSSEKLELVAQEKMPRLTVDRQIFNILPISNEDAHIVAWEQKDNYIGLQQLRGLNGQPQRVANVGLNRFQMEPGVYGEYMDIDEDELTKRRKIGEFGTPIDLTDLVYEKQDQLLLRRLDVIEYIGWKILQGTFTVSGPQSQVIHTDTYTLRTHTASPGWTTANTSTPLNDFRTIKLKHRGYSVSFGAQATAYMNATTYNAMANNTNTADIFGRRTMGLSTINNLGQINALLTGDDLPQIVVYDQGYLDSTGTFQLFIPDGIVIVVGKRPAGQVVGGYRMTRNVNNPNFGPGPYTKVVDSADAGTNPVPRVIQVHDGHNGGPTIAYPSTVIVATMF
jgi:hypothetical protein